MINACISLISMCVLSMSLLSCGEITPTVKNAAPQNFGAPHPLANTVEKIINCASEILTRLKIFSKNFLFSLINILNWKN